jgi:hypothetical protein
VGLKRLVLGKGLRVGVGLDLREVGRWRWREGERERESGVVQAVVLPEVVEEVVGVVEGRWDESTSLPTGVAGAAEAAALLPILRTRRVGGEMGEVVDLVVQAVDSPFAGGGGVRCFFASWASSCSICWRFAVDRDWRGDRRVGA